MPIAGNLFYFGSGPDRLLRPPTILIHGAGGHHLFWPPQIRRLHEERIFAPDLPGHGKSSGLGRHAIEDYSADVLEFVGILNLSASVLVGHSMGGAIALDIALRFPERVTGLVLVGTGARLRVAPELLRSTADPSTASEAFQLMSDLSFSPETDLRLKETASQRLAETRLPVLHGDLLACDKFDVREQLPGISVPTLVLCGAVDRMTPPAYSAFLQQKIPGARLAIVERAGHMVMLEQPEAVATLIGDFLQTIVHHPGR